MRALHIAALAILAGCARLATPSIPFAPQPAAAADKAALLRLTPELDAFFQKKFDAAQPTGLAVGLVLDGELIYARSFGALDRAVRRPVDGETLFRIASLTKSFTALAVLKLRDAGAIELDAPLVRYLPELASVAVPVRDAPALTARMLLTHASGLPWDDTWSAVSFGLSADELLRLLAAGVSFGHVPGEAYEYSNLGYALLGRLVERVSGVPYRTYVTREILAPLGMRHAAWAPEVASAPPDNLAVGYWGDPGAETVAPRPSDGVFEAAGGLYASLHDLARYAAYQLAAYPARDAPEAGPVRRSTLREQHRGQRITYGPGEPEPIVQRSESAASLWLTSYGFGWSNVTTCSEQRVQHGGWEPGYFAGLTLLPAHRLGIISLATSRSLGPLTIPLLELLRTRGALPRAWEPEPAPAWREAQRRSLQLLERWDDAVASGLFEPGWTHYPWSRSLQQELAAARQAHGRCTTVEPLRVLSRQHAAFRVGCERGAMALELFLSPRAAARVVFLKLREELPVSEVQRGMASRIASHLRGEGELEASLFASAADEARVRKALAHARIDWQACALGSAAHDDGHGQATFELRCADSALELGLSLDETGKLSQLELRAAQEAGGACEP